LSNDDIFLITFALLNNKVITFYHNCRTLLYSANNFDRGFHRGSCCRVICVSLFHVIVLSFVFRVLIVHQAQEHETILDKIPNFYC